MRDRDTAFMNPSASGKSGTRCFRHRVHRLSRRRQTQFGNDDRRAEAGYRPVAAIHLKDTLPVTGDSPGQFRDVPFGEGCVDFVGIFQTLHELNYRGSFLIEMDREPASRCWKLSVPAAGLNHDAGRRLHMLEQPKAEAVNPPLPARLVTLPGNVSAIGMRRAKSDGHQAFRR